MTAILLAFAGLAGYAGFACLALAMPDYWLRVGGKPEGEAARARRLRRLGVPMLCIAAAACVWRDGAGFGILLWTLLTPACAIAVALTLSWAPGLLGRLFRSTRGGITNG